MKIQTTSGNCLVLMCADAARGRMDVPQKAKASRVNECAGFTVVELLVVIAIIGVLVEMLCPAIQTQRHLNVRRAVDQDLLQLVAAANAFHEQNGTFAGSLTDLANFCAAHPELCLLDAELASGQKNGYFFKLSQPSRSGSSTQEGPQMVAGPIYPGITGLDTVVADQDGNLLSFMTPGAEAAQQQALDRIRAKGAEMIAALLRLNRDAPPRARDFVRSPDTQNLVFNTIDANHDRRVSVDEFRNVNTGSELPLSDLLDFVNEELKFDTLSVETRRAIGADLSQLEGDPAQAFTYDGLCNLTWWYITDQGIADSLCAKLRAAEAAEARGDNRTKANLIRAYSLQVAALTCTTLTIKQATTLTTLAMTL
jgi:prepilin-type N-terminal cleavage/methylation domain-containing protein